MKTISTSYIVNIDHNELNVSAVEPIQALEVAIGEHFGEKHVFEPLLQSKNHEWCAVGNVFKCQQKNHNGGLLGKEIVATGIVVHIISLTDPTQALIDQAHEEALQEDALRARE
jgi:hypothetical protein